MERVTQLCEEALLGNVKGVELGKLMAVTQSEIGRLQVTEKWPGPCSKRLKSYITVIVFLTLTLTLTLTLNLILNPNPSTLTLIMTLIGLCSKRLESYFQRMSSLRGPEVVKTSVRNAAKSMKDGRVQKLVSAYNELVGADRRRWRKGQQVAAAAQRVQIGLRSNGLKDEANKIATFISEDTNNLDAVKECGILVSSLKKKTRDEGAVELEALVLRMEHLVQANPNSIATATIILTWTINRNRIIFSGKTYTGRAVYESARFYQLARSAYPKV